MLYISVVSHGHYDLINRLELIERVSKLENTILIIKNNLEQDRGLLTSAGNLIVVDRYYGLGFGENNNLAYREAIKLGANSQDVFLVLNPDVEFDQESISEFLKCFNNHNLKIATVKLMTGNEPDYNVRAYPTLIGFLSSFLGLGKEAKQKYFESKSKSDLTEIDWASGAFLAFRVSQYDELNGFNEKYFMYCEDIDICLRSTFKLGEPVRYLPSITLQHIGARKSSSIFSRHFYWHLKSICLFLLEKSKYKIRN